MIYITQVKEEDPRLKTEILQTWDNHWTVGMQIKMSYGYDMQSSCRFICYSLGISLREFRNKAKEYGAVCKRVRIRKNRPMEFRMAFDDSSNASRFQTEYLDALVLANLISEQ